MYSNNMKTIKVWDPLVRIFHWTLVFCFFVAYLTEDDRIFIHSYAGYTIALLVLFRLLWGIIGTKYARFSNFVTPLETIKVYLQKLFTGNGQHYLGHNPAGGLMIVILLFCLIFTTITGMSLLATEGHGPFASTFLSSLSDDILENVHELFANLTLLMVVIHLSGVLVSSLLHKENLIKSMITGTKFVDVGVDAEVDIENKENKL